MSPPFACNSVRVLACVCVRSDQERGERERDTRVKQIGRAATETAAFGHVLDTEADRPQRLHTEK